MQGLLGLAEHDLACPWEWMVYNRQRPPTWLLAERLQAEGIVGIVVNSYAPGCTVTNRNLVLWRWSTAKPHAIEVIDDLSRLPNNQLSWVS